MNHFNVHSCGKGIGNSNAVTCAQEISRFKSTRVHPRLRENKISERRPKAEKKMKAAARNTFASIKEVVLINQTARFYTTSKCYSAGFVKHLLLRALLPVLSFLG